MNNTYIITFNKKSPNRNGWVEVQTLDLDKATEIAVEKYGMNWSMVHGKENFNPQYFPDGCLR